jgi:hypothetical protein
LLVVSTGDDSMSRRPAISELPRALVDAMPAEEAAEQEVENAAKSGVAPSGQEGFESRAACGKKAS